MSDLLNQLCGKVLGGIEHLEASDEWVFKFAGDISLSVSAPWRLVHRGEVCIGFEDHGHRFGLPQPVEARKRFAEVAVGKPVASAATSPLGDLAIQFGEHAALEVFNASCGYEGWVLNAPGNHWVVAQGGGRVIES